MPSDYFQPPAGRLLVLVCAHDGTRQRPRLKQGEAQKYRVSHDAPDAHHDIVCERNALDHNSVYADADHDEETLETECKERPEIVLPDVALLPVPEGGKRDRRQARHEIDLHHASVNDDKDHNGEDHGADLDNEGLHEYPKKFPYLQSLQRGAEIRQCGSIYLGAAGDEAGACIDHVLRNVEDGHCDVEGVGDQHHCDGGLEDPFKDDPCLKVCQVVVFDDQLNELITGYEREEQACYGDDDALRDVPDHGEYPG